MAQELKHQDLGSSFELQGKRETVLTAERAAELLQPLLDPNQVPRVSRLKLSGKSFNVPAAEIVAKAVQRVEGLQIADFADIIAAQPTEEARKVLEIVCNSLSKHQLVELNLSDNALGARGVAACSGALKGQKCLQRIYFSNNGLEGEAVRLIKELVLDNVDPTVVTTFHISNNLLRDTGAKQLAELLPKLPNLRDVKIAGTRIDTAGGLALSQSLNSMHHLVSLDLSDNSLGSKSAPHLAQVIRQNHELRVLNLSDTGLDSGAILILKALPSVPHLQDLNLSFNEFNDAAASKLLAASVAPLSKLIKISLENSEIGNRGVRALIPWFSSHQNLTSVNLYRNNISSSALEDLSKSLSKLKLASLNLNGNKFKPSALQIIKDAYQESADILGSLSDNEDEYSQSEEEEEQEEAEEDESVKELTSELNKQHI